MLNNAQHGDVLNAKPGSAEDKAALVDELKRRGNAAFKVKSLPEADLLYSKAIEHKPEEKSLWSNRSAGRALMGRFDEALSDADEAVRLADDWPKAHMRRGQALKGLKRYRDAQHSFERVCKLEPKNKAMMKEVEELERLAERAEQQAEADAKAGSSNATSEAKRKRVVQRRAPASNEAQSAAQPKTKSKGGSDMRGYRVRDNGTVTSYFHTERTEEEKKLIGDICPKRINPDSLAAAEEKTSVGASSVWNKGATFEERDMNEWAKKRLAELLKGIQSQGPSEGKGQSSTVIEVTDVSEIDGDASISFIRGSKRFIFDYSFLVNWSASEGEEKGAIFIPDFSGNNDPNDELESELRWGSSTSISSARQTLLKTTLASLKDEIAARLRDFYEEFRQQ